MKKLVSFFLVLFVVSLQSFSCFAEAASESSSIEENFTKVSESNGKILYANENNGEIVVYDKTNDSYWFSNPQQADSDPLANTVAKGELRSQIIIEYATEKNKNNYMNSYNDSVELGQFTSEIKNNTFSASYVFGERKISIDDIPTCLSEKRFKSLTKKMDEEDVEALLKRYEYIKIEDFSKEQQDELLEKYKKLADGPLYILGQIPQYDIPKFYDIWNKAGYTLEDLKSDNEENGIEAEYNVVIQFELSISYSLDKGELVATLDCENIKTPDSDEIHLTKITVLPYFGAGSISESGYIFVPDGCGSLINFNNNKLSAKAYGAEVYGTNYALLQRNHLKNQQPVVFPVFGVKKAGSSYITIIEEGDAIASISADISGRNNSYNYVHASFKICENDVIESSTSGSLSTMSVYQKSTYNGKIILRYCFLENEDGSYVGMATRYQQYLEKQGVLLKQNTETAQFMNLQILGAIEKEKKFFGITYSGIEKLTTFKQAQVIFNDLNESGVKNINVRYSGFCNDGLNQSYLGRFKLEKSLGTKKQFLNLYNSIKNDGSVLFPDVSLIKVYSNRNGYNSKSLASRRVNGSTIKWLPFNIVTNFKDKDGISFYLNNINGIKKSLNKFLKKMDSWGVNTVSFSDTEMLTGDFSSKKIVNRQDTALLISEELQSAQLANRKFMLSGCNAYALSSANALVNIPTQSSNFLIADSEVPFVQIVLKGYIPYSGESVNLTEDATDSMLKAVETGAIPAFTVMYSDEEGLKNTDCDYMFDVEYNSVRTQIIDFYNRFQPFVEKIYNETIINHSKITDDLVITEFSNGLKVLINYDDVVVNWNGYTVPQKDFLIIK